MNIVKVNEGLGNQLFQYAFSKRIEKQCGGKVALDISHYSTTEGHNPKFIEREFMLDKFDLDYKIADPEDLQIVHDWEFEPEKNYKNTCFDGWWQKASLFEGIPLDIKIKPDVIFSFPDRTRRLAEKMQSENSVAIHVRRCDYAVFPKWLLDMSYYVRAVEKIKELVPRPEFYVFSDNIFWTERNLPLDMIHYVYESDLEDFWLMSQCKHNIIANSTYSFWAAYLNKNQNYVIYPEDWKCGQRPVDFKNARWISV